MSRFEALRLTTAALCIAAALPAAAAALVAAALPAAAEAADLLAVDGRGSTVILTGTSGTIRRSTDGALTSSPVVPSPSTGAALRDVVDAGSAFVAVGDGGAVYASNLDGSAWGAVASGTSNALHAVARIGASLVASGAGGTILRTSNLSGAGSWDAVPVASAVEVTLYDIGPSTSHSYAVGQQGTIVQGNLLGTSFPTIIDDVPTAAALHAFTLMGSNTLIAVGDGGVILRSTDDGLTWDLLVSPTASDLRAVAVSGDGAIAIAVGLGGVLIWSNDGISWALSGASPLRADLHAAAFENGYFVIAGAGGLVARAQPTAVALEGGWEYTAVRPVTWGQLKQGFRGGR